jgi:hypothetical protein
MALASPRCGGAATGATVCLWLALVAEGGVLAAMGAHGTRRGAGPPVAVQITPACNDARNCAAALNAAFDACTTASACSISFTADTFLFTVAPFDRLTALNNAQNVDVNGNGSTWLVDNIANIVIATACANVTFRNFTVDMQRLPFTYGSVVASNATWSTVQFDGNAYPYDAAAQAQWPWLLQAQGILGFDPTTWRVANNAVDVYALGPVLPVQPLTSSSFAVKQGKLDVGSWVIVRHQTYAYNGISLESCSDVTVANVTMLAVAGMGVVGDGVTNVLLDGFRVARAPGRPMSITADGAHFTSCRGGGVILRNCLFEGQGDDALNVPSMYQDVESIDATRTVLTVGKNNVVQAPRALPTDVLQVYARKTFQLYGTVTVASVAGNTLTLAGPLPAAAAQYDLLLNTNSTPAYVEVRTGCWR